MSDWACAAGAAARSAKAAAASTETRERFDMGSSREWGEMGFAPGGERGEGPGSGAEGRLRRARLQGRGYPSGRGDRKALRG